MEKVCWMTINLYYLLERCRFFCLPRTYLTKVNFFPRRVLNIDHLKLFFAYPTEVVVCIDKVLQESDYQTILQLAFSYSLQKPQNQWFNWKVIRHCCYCSWNMTPKSVNHTEKQNQLKYCENSDPIDSKSYAHHYPQYSWIIDSLLINVLRLTFRCSNVCPKYDVTPYKHSEES